MAALLLLAVCPESFQAGGDGAAKATALSSLKPHQPLPSLPVCFPRSSPFLSAALCQLPCTPEDIPIRKHVQARGRARVGAAEPFNTGGRSGQPAPTLQYLLSTARRSCRHVRALSGRTEMTLARGHCGDEGSARRQLANTSS